MATEKRRPLLPVVARMVEGYRGDVPPLDVEEIKRQAEVIESLPADVKLALVALTVQRANKFLEGAFRKK